MQYLMLLYQTPDDFSARLDGQNEAYWGPWRAYHKALTDAGVRVGGSPLHPGSTGTTVRLRGGQRQVQDGPYADSKEELGGYIVLELPSFDAALEWAACCPTAATGAVEIRPIADRQELAHIGKVPLEWMASHG